MYYTNLKLAGKPKQGKHYRLGVTADWHVGNPSAKIASIKLMLKSFAAGNVDRWICQGDMVEAVLPSDKKRFSIATHKDSLLQSCGEVASMVWEARKNCIGLLMGNHEHSGSSEIGNIMSEHICKIADVPYLGFMGFVDVVCPKGKLKWFVAHGARSNIQRNPNPLRRQVNKEMALINLLHDYDADLKGCGHWHTEIVIPPVDELSMQLHDDKIRLRERQWQPSWCYSLPSMFTSFTESEDFPSYAERMMLKPTSLGWLEAVISTMGRVEAIESFDEDGKLRHVYEGRTTIA